ncbi:MAG: phosphatase PAP2 family protein [Chloroflexi bacterium]|nr:phosphatase PAP2 family protein [Chloroflexota bacterium]
MTTFARDAVRLNTLYAPRAFLAMGRAAGAAALFTAITLAHAILRSMADDASPNEPYNTSRLEIGVFRALPSEWMQDVLGTTGVAPDIAFLVWRTLFGLPVLLAAMVCVVWGWRALFGLLAVLAALLLTADCFYFILPTRPPWMDADVARIIAMQQTNGTHLDNNELAALPSLHIAVVVSFGCWFWGLGRPGARWIARAHMVWALAMAWALVYSGEHYAIDTVIGAAQAVVVFVAVRSIGLAYPPSLSAAIAALERDGRETRDLDSLAA